MDNTDKLNIREADGGAIITVKVVPGASRDRVAGVLGDHLKITTSAPPEAGKANAAVVKILAKAFGVQRKDVQLTSGQTNPRKEFCIKGHSAEQVRKLLAAI